MAELFLCNCPPWMPLDLTDDKSTLVQVMAWCCQTTSHYLSQCWPRYLSPYGVTRPQWVNSSLPSEHCIYVSLSWVITGSDNGLSPVWHQKLSYAIIWINEQNQGTEINGTIIETTPIVHDKIALKIIVCNFPAILSQGEDTRWINSLMPNDTIWCHGSGPPLNQIMSCLFDKLLPVPMVTYRQLNP